MDKPGSTPSPSFIEDSAVSRSQSVPYGPSPASLPSPPPPSLSRQLIDGALALGVFATIATHLPWCLSMYEKGDWKPLSAATIALYLLAARASPEQVVSLVTKLLPGKSGGEK